MKKSLHKIIAVALTSMVMMSTLAGCGSSKTTTDTSGKPVTLTYAIWDKNQQPGMQAIADSFHKLNPNITVKVEVTPWDSYWTKMDAGATSGTLPDVFWMHSNNFTKYANGGVLMDLTDTIKNSKDVKMSNFPKDLVSLYTLKDKVYAMPKDYDTIALWYNKTMFDKKGIAYPDGTWDWNKYLEVAKKLTDSSKGVFGCIAPSDDQQGYYNYVYQNKGYILSPDNKKSGFSLAATKEAIQWDVDLSQKYKVSPTQQQFADTSFATYFESGKAAMGLFGSWMVSEFKANDYVSKNCNVAVIPHGKTKATIINGLANVVSAKTKHSVEALKFEDFLGTKAANTIQSEKGAAIPAYAGTAQPFIDNTKQFNLKVYPEMLNYAVLFPNSATKAKWYEIQNNTMMKVYTGQLTVEQGCSIIDKQMNALLATEK
ncbi:ABC transporter substrate-binding protein [Clostridium estertheticum]|uniref:ABC transporter substrate-binding protein n=1 Tax=Clostridium estertheticum TaxID=238834 RepID=UPI001C7D4873|nr:sugar ABC transporter substrate-binding protein [Clostridium estertheticum]MBX4266914.1 extracellular solute-binding protein [Clostridium estertheticum]MBX4271243.1 extracellular solute-binding protein [Clostridium estertheticum]WLC78725.1 extracellular solute-binding protein [Clostridium estertheticum]WLC89747.1 extracellular solute-binding protein [Clostridium estertheticum]